MNQGMRPPPPPGYGGGGGYAPHMQPPPPPMPSSHQQMMGRGLPPPPHGMGGHGMGMPMGMPMGMGMLSRVRRARFGIGGWKRGLSCYRLVFVGSERGCLFCSLVYALFPGVVGAVGWDGRANGGAL